MAQVGIQTPSGQVVQIQVPEGATDEQIQAFVAANRAELEAQAATQTQAPAPAAAAPPAQERGLLEQIGGGLETAAAVGSGILAEPISGIAGIGAAVLPDVLTGGADPGDVVRAAQEAFTFRPRSEAGQEQAQALGELVAPIGEALQGTEKALGDFAFELTGSPAAAATAATIPTAILEGLGLGALRKLRRGTKLLDDTGAPTKELKSALDKEGLVFENLTPETKAKIPAVADPNLIPGGEVKGVAEQAVIDQINSGGRDAGLAKFEVKGNRIKADKLAEKASAQGFEDGFIQAVKTAQPGSRRAMAEMLEMTERIKGNQRLALDFRPTNVVGESVSKRLTFIRDTADVARRELNQIADNQMAGVPMDPAPIVNSLRTALDNLDVTVSPGPGKPELTFEGSLISKDRTSQRVIKDLVDLMAEGGQPDALRFHKMKRQLDNMIDFRKKSAGGLSEAGRNVLKTIRFDLNDNLRQANPDYARVNDTLSEALTTFDDIQDIAGKKINIFGKGSTAALGQEMRKLMSNVKTRVPLENALQQIDDTAANFGGRFDDDVRDLALFARSIEDRFGAVAKTSFKGEIEGAQKPLQAFGIDLAQATIPGVTAAAIRTGVSKVRRVNDFNAFRAMEDLIKRGQNKPRPQPGSNIIPRP